ncbi:MAG TPA: DUF2939 domain-containing protein [Trinickia sp.]|jgi:hypothetical protein|uniref:DUF2939 domain-containing protein n=1 Tax=Trinickia sp. TaxID=2571163 RepID=UPI002CDBDED1|nr:DUF2939 domain-containing protein [Trinickia sp.]HTI17964.1 DUF2939 domain-containing protein [Trinickia sp.]
MTYDKPNPSRHKPLTIIVLVVAMLVAFAVVGYGYATPYLALNHLKRAVDARDAETVNAYVDYPALRTSLKQELTELLSRRVEAQKSENPFAALGALVGMALIGPLVDQYATPDGVIALLNGIPPSGKPGDVLHMAPAPAPSNGAGPQAASPAPSPSAEAPPAKPAPAKIAAHYRGIDEFVVTYRHDAESAPYSVILHRAGWFSWKLVAVDLNE